MSKKEFNKEVLKEKVDFIKKSYDAHFSKKGDETESYGLGGCVYCIEFTDGIHHVTFPEDATVQYSLTVNGGDVVLEVISDGELLDRIEVSPGAPGDSSFSVPSSKSIIFKITPHNDGDVITYVLCYSY